MPETKTIDVLLADLRWWGNAIAGNGPMSRYAKAAKDAEAHWYQVTLPMLYKLNAVYAYQVPSLNADLSEEKVALAAYLPSSNGGAQ
jgi:hypothetical protein